MALREETVDWRSGRERERTGDLAHWTLVAWAVAAALQSVRREESRAERGGSEDRSGGGRESAVWIWEEWVRAERRGVAWASKASRRASAAGAAVGMGEERTHTRGSFVIRS